MSNIITEVKPKVSLIKRPKVSLVKRPKVSLIKVAKPVQAAPKVSLIKKINMRKAGH